MLISTIDPHHLTQTQIANLVFGNPQATGGADVDTAPGYAIPQYSQTSGGGITGDCIFVFGGSHTERVDKAVEIYKAGRAPFILFTGGSKWGQKPVAEALEMRERAMARGVPEKAIFVECQSNHTKENVLASLLVLDRAIGLHRLRRLLVVSAPHHMRRCLLTLRTYMPRWVEFIWCPDDRPHPRAENWWQRPEDEQLVLKEIHSLVRYVRENQILDQDVVLG